MFSTCSYWFLVSLYNNLEYIIRLLIYMTLTTDQALALLDIVRGILVIVRRAFIMITSHIEKTLPLIDKLQLELKGD